MNRPPTPHRIWAKWSGGLCVVAGLLAGHVVHAQQAIFVHVPMELSAGALRTALPFDEPFLLVGARPAELLRIEGAYHARGIFRSRKVDCENSSGWEDSVTAWPANGTVPSDSFFVEVPPLKGDRLYVFCLQTLTSPITDSLSLFHQRARIVLDSAFQESGTGDLPQGAARELQESLLDALNPPPGSHVRPIRNSVFDTSATNAALLQSVLQLRDPQQHRASALNQIQVEVAATATALKVLARDSALGALARGLAKNPLPDLSAPDVASTLLISRMLSIQAPLDSIRLATYLDGVASGEVALGPDLQPIPPGPVLRKVWKPDALEMLLPRLAETQERLGQIRTVLLRMAGSAGIRKGAGLTVPQVLRLLGEVDNARAALNRSQAAHSELQGVLEDRERRLDAAVERLGLMAQHTAPIQGSSIDVEVETRAKRYVSADLGVLHAWDLGQTAPYVAASISLAPINKRIPQRLVSDPRKSISVITGLTVNSVAVKDKADDLFSSYSPVVGLGVRFFDFLRASAGGVAVRDLGGTSSEPEKHLRLAPFFALSYDADVAGAFSKIGKLWPSN